MFVLQWNKSLANKMGHIEWHRPIYGKLHPQLDFLFVKILYVCDNLCHLTCDLSLIWLVGFFNIRTVVYMTIHESHLEKLQFLHLWYIKTQCHTFDLLMLFQINILFPSEQIFLKWLRIVIITLHIELNPLINFNLNNFHQLFYIAKIRRLIATRNMYRDVFNE